MNDTENPYISPTIESSCTVPAESSRKTNSKSLFSFKGRICRSTFIGSWFLFTFGLPIVCSPVTFAVLSFWEDDRVRMVWFGCLGFVMLWGFSALLTKRLHDLNYRGIICLWVLVVPFVFGALRLEEGPFEDNVLQGILFLCWFILACKKGTRGTNRFGEDPLSGIESASAATVDKNQDEIIYSENLIGCQKCSWTGTWADALASSPRDGFICPNCYADDPRRIPLTDGAHGHQ
jgi:uncharacterized membrane protein YhaH (DUF805 family)